MKCFALLTTALICASSLFATTLETQWQPSTPRNILSSMGILARLYVKIKLPNRNTILDIIQAKKAVLKTIKKVEDGFLQSRNDDQKLSGELLRAERMALLKSVMDFISLVFKNKKHLKPMITASLKNRDEVNFENSPVVGFVGQSNPKNGIQYLLQKISTEEDLKQICVELYLIISDIIESVPKAKKIMEKIENELLEQNLNTNVPGENGKTTNKET